MNSGIQALLAVMPIIAAAVLLVGFRWPAKKAMPIVYAAAALIAFFAWQMSAIRILASTIQGLIITLSILWIIFGAILLLNTLKYSGAITAIRKGFTTISSDRRVHVGPFLANHYFPGGDYTCDCRYIDPAFYGHDDDAIFRQK